jgi:hypothetical protein
VFVGAIGARPADLDRLIRRLRGKASERRFVYEAGPRGYSLYRYLTGKGLTCDVQALQALRGVQWVVGRINVPLQPRRLIMAPAAVGCSAAQTGSNSCRSSVPQAVALASFLSRSPRSPTRATISSGLRRSDAASDQNSLGSPGLGAVWISPSRRFMHTALADSNCHAYCDGRNQMPRPILIEAGAVLSGFIDHHVHDFFRQLCAKLMFMLDPFKI